MAARTVCKHGSEDCEKLRELARGEVRMPGDERIMGKRTGPREGKVTRTRTVLRGGEVISFERLLVEERRARAGGGQAAAGPNGANAARSDALPPCGLGARGTADDVPIIISLAILQRCFRISCKQHPIFVNWQFF